MKRLKNVTVRDQPKKDVIDMAFGNDMNIRFVHTKVGGQNVLPIQTEQFESIQTEGFTPLQTENRNVNA